MDDIAVRSFINEWQQNKKQKYEPCKIRTPETSKTVTTLEVFNYVQALCSINSYSQL